MRVTLALLVLMAGCSAPVAPQVPAELQVCPDPVPATPAPASPRSAKKLFDWSKENELARERTASAFRECAHRLDRLNMWILEHVKD